MARGGWGHWLALGAVIVAQGSDGGIGSPAPEAQSPMIIPIHGGNPRGVDAVATGSPPSPAGGGGGGPTSNLDAPLLMGPWFIRFDPPVDRRGDPGPAGTSEPTLGPGSPAPRR